MQIGRIGTRLADDYDTPLVPKQRIISLSLESIIARLSSKVTSYRETCSILNLLLHREQEDMFHHRTIADHEESVARKAEASLDSHVRHVLSSCGFDPETGLPADSALLASSIVRPDIPSVSDGRWHERVREAVETWNCSHDKEFSITDLPVSSMPETDVSEVVMISIDDVLAKRQKDSRGEGRPRTGKRNVENTVIHIQANGRAFVLTALSMDEAMRRLMAFLLENHLMEDRQLLFFSDGANNIRAALERFFSWRPYVLILDWFHLAKRIRELSSSAFTGNKAAKQEVIRRILNHLWPGNVDNAIRYIASLRKTNGSGRPAKGSIVRNEATHQELMDYLERKKKYIACHSVRRSFNYRISSNTSEKANDLVVADRQKHNGMSWSFEGSGALALISSMLINRVFDFWLVSGDFNMSIEAFGWEVNSVRVA